MGEEQSPVGAAYSAGKFSTQRRKGAKLQGVFCLAPIASWRLGVNSFTDDFAPTELDSFTLSFLQIGQSYGLGRLRFRLVFVGVEVTRLISIRFLDFQSETPHVVSCIFSVQRDETILPEEQIHIITAR